MPNVESDMAHPPEATHGIQIVCRTINLLGIIAVRRPTKHKPGEAKTLRIREVLTRILGSLETDRHESWDQLTELFRISPHLFAASAIGAAAISPALGGQRLEVGIALSLVAAQVLMRAVAWHAFRNRSQKTSYEVWFRRFTILSILSGIAWGTSLAVLFVGAEPQSQVITLAVGCGIVQSASGRAYMAPRSTLIVLLIIMGLMNLAAFTEGQWILLPICVAYLFFQATFMSRLIELEMSRRQAEDETKHLLRELADSNHKLKRANERLQQHALTDALTGLPNRRSFDRQLTRAVLERDETGAPLSLILLDIDHFKQFNDRYGHQEGDKCLQHVAGVLARHADENGYQPARYGGEEFAVILPSTPRETAADVAERLRRQIANLPFRISNGTEIKITASFGVAQFQQGDVDAKKQLIAQADRNLYRAKEQGRNCVISRETEADPLHS
ncbi:diguanylate cyclase [Peteryoungia desertarenae]|uniref:diguanylate cyclase n=1 Tax=Peteryoungia desertarenae TaxID=1813451 RepID=A0ABX6QQG3_9HYPH|nr:GGDEF domain-containing protein [Peteryoungia desertarenae]QLF70775.1 diguanylate cyclase [Peteryoungia desertarenae]